MSDYTHAFRNGDYAALLAQKIKAVEIHRQINLMEVCGSHTVAIFKYGIREMLPPHIRLVSGPGCPVCVTANGFIDRAIAIAAQKDVIICTFGDMLRVPGSESSLNREKTAGRDIRICLSPTDAVKIAAAHPAKRIVFLGIGFETTAPAIAASIKMAERRQLTNYYVLSALKTLPHALDALIRTEEFNVQGFICPGHVSAITGTGIYTRITEEHRIPCVVTGFEPLDLLQGILMLAEQIAAGRAETAIQYSRAVTAAGNLTAQHLMQEVFAPDDAVWRGLGNIPGSGLKPGTAYARYDAGTAFDVTLPEEKNPPGCLCGAIMRGNRIPTDCSLFAAACTPQDPQGACMVSGEGTCSTYYKYSRRPAG